MRAAVTRKCTDHPRSRGVYRRHSGRFGLREGSSPLARGLPFAASPLDAQGGIIPARAGFTWDILSKGQFDGDHPRSRGVYGSLRALAAERGGSSPLARGLLGRQRAVQRERGIIPARAGFTGRRLRVRGRHPRIIPARAGFTDSRGARLKHFGDHPRSRGVYLTGRRIHLPFGGSSPLARGLLRRTRCGRQTPGIIPARAGFTRQVRSSSTRSSDHPRSRGVYPVQSWISI